MNKYFFSLFLFLISIGFSFSQQEVEMADKFYTEGKVYVVVAVVSILVVGMIAYLFLMDRRISKIEKELKNKNSH